MELEIPCVSKKRSGISRGDEKSCGISMGSWCLALEVPMGVTQFVSGLSKD